MRRVCSRQLMRQNVESSMADPVHQLADSFTVLSLGSVQERPGGSYWIPLP